MGSDFFTIINCNNICLHLCLNKIGQWACYYEKDLLLVSSRNNLKTASHMKGTFLNGDHMS